MNLFIIPSWYPSCSSPIAGVFTKEQVEAIGELAQNVRVMVSLWGHDESELLSRKPQRWFNQMLWYWQQPHDQVRERNGIEEIFNPKLHWTKRLPFGGAKQLIEVNRRNFRLAASRCGGVDLIHAHVSYPAGYIASILSREFGVPYVLTEHMSPFPFLSLTKGERPVPEIEQAFSMAAASIAVSPSLAERVASFGYVAPKVIPNMVDERLFHLGKERRGKTIFFTLCGISEQKGIDVLLSAIALWNPPTDRFEFRIGGDGPLRDAYEARARMLGLDDRVRWLGPVSRSQAPELFRDCDIYVMPSRHETFGVVYAEAIASGKPIIATRCGGPEYIVNDGNGVLVDVGDVSALSHAMECMAENLNGYDAYAIREDFEQRFSRIAVVRQLSALYEEVLKG
ncbi:glycosyltransferase [Metapseudomonas otitidis]|uniref:glycosyltransferase n=1 Tax=Metapseudomonas otitidis TaxID=319939 RepID=UPI00254131DB|nr:glycosyltransferase [Pseudomonas otitidis]WIF65917.1 glycosyltransferase [Pseudomonas otitidis]